MSQRRLDLVLKFASPNALAAFASASRVAHLYHESSDVTVNLGAIVRSLAAVCEKVFTRCWRRFTKELDLYISSICVQLVSNSLPPLTSLLTVTDMFVRTAVKVVKVTV